MRALNPRFPCGSTPEVLNLATYNNSPDRSTKSTTSHLNVLCVLVNTRFQVLFHSPPGVLFTFPSRYYALSVTGSYLALEGGPPCFPPDSSCPVVLWILTACFGFRVRGSYPLWHRFPTSSAILYNAYVSPQPRSTVVNRFGLFRFRSPLLTESRLISLPPAT